MTLKTFTTDEIQKLKAASAKTHNGRVIQIDLGDPINETIVVAPFSREEYATHYDKKTRDIPTAAHGALLEQAIYPDRPTIETLRQQWAVIPGAVTDQLVQEAGFTLETAVVRQLADDDLPAGLDSATAAKLRETHKGRLWSVELAGHKLSLVMLAPLSDVYLAAQSAYGDAARASNGIVATIDSYVLGTVVWSRVPLTTSGGATGLLDLEPALIWDLWQAYKRTGGDGAAVRRKSL